MQGQTVRENDEKPKKRGEEEGAPKRTQTDTHAWRANGAEETVGL